MESNIDEENDLALEEFNKAMEAAFNRLYEEAGYDMSEDDQVAPEEENNGSLSPLSKEGRSWSSTHFNGFTREQMNLMFYSPFEEGCPVQLNTLTEEQISQIPLMRQVLQMMNSLAREEAKLTKKGSLPTKLVEEVYMKGRRSPYADQYKRKTQDICLDVMIIRTMLEGAGMIKKRKGMMSLTAKGKKLLKDHNQLLRSFFLYLFTDYNVAWLDRYDDYDSGLNGRLYSLWLFHHYGESWCNTETIAVDYYKAFGFRGLTEAYTFRIFTALFHLIGISDIRPALNKEKYGKYAYMFPQEEVQKTPLLEMIFSFEEPAQI